MTHLCYRIKGDTVFLRDEASRKRYTVKKDEVKKQLENAIESKGKRKTTKRVNFVSEGENFDLLIIPNNKFYPSKYYVKEHLKNTGIDDKHYLKIIIKKENKDKMDFMQGDNYRHKTEIIDKEAINFIKEMLGDDVSSEIRQRGNKIDRSIWEKNGVYVKLGNNLLFDSEELIKSIEQKSELEEKEHGIEYKFSDIEREETYIDSSCYVCGECTSNMTSLHLSEDKKEDCIFLYCAKCQNYFLRKEIRYPHRKVSEYNLQ